MTPAQIQSLRKRFPKAPESFFQRQINHENTDHHNSRLRPAAPKPVERLPLDDARGAEEAHWYDAAGRFEIVFTVYSVRPADYDGFDIKALQDFLVSAGIIPSDKWNVLSGRVVSRKAATEAEEKTVVEITAIEL